MTDVEYLVAALQTGPVGQTAFTDLEKRGLHLPLGIPRLNDKLASCGRTPPIVNGPP